MGKIQKFIALFAICLAVPAAVHARPRGAPPVANLSTGISQLNLRPLGQTPGAEYPFLNLLKEADEWTLGGPNALPTELDSNGYPLVAFAQTLVNTPSQATRPGNYVFVWTGSGNFQLGFNGGGVNRNFACVGTGTNPGNAARCDNSACSAFTASISGTTLTVSAAPTGTGCTFRVGLPISTNGATVAVSKFGTPTIISGMSGSANCPTCTGAGGTGTYLVNISQTTSGTMYLGGRMETNITTPFPTTTTDRWIVANSGTFGAGLQRPLNMALYHIDDEALYIASANPCPGNPNSQACLIGQLFKNRVQAGNFKVLRDLDWIKTNVSNCTTWSSRKPIGYYSWGFPEFRNAPLGNDANGYINPGQYVDAGGTGASGGTVSYNGGTNTYSITLGTGGPVDKQTIIMKPPSSGTTASLISLNGTASVGIGDMAGGQTLAPSANLAFTMVYDAAINRFLSKGGTQGGLNCVVPPEVFIEVNAELGTTPWHSAIFMALDPMTDWIREYATYIKANYPGVKPIFEVSNEPFNFVTQNACYASTKSNVWITADPTKWTSGSFFCGASGNIMAEFGKWGSTMGQDLTTVFGAGNFELLAPAQSVIGAAGSVSNPVLRANEYVTQTLIPTQSGYIKAPAYNYVTRVSINNYWNTGYFHATYAGTSGAAYKGLEVGLGYCYYNYSISTPCQGLYASQAAVMTALYASNSIAGGTNASAFSPAQLAVVEAAYNTWASTCSEAVRPGSCTINASKPLMFYEGTFNETGLAAGATQAITSATNATQARINTSGTSGCSVGSAVALYGLSGGTWSNAEGAYTIQSCPASTALTINLNSTGLGTLVSGTVTFDITQPITSASNAVQARLTTANPNGCVVGSTVTLFALAGGTWSSAAGLYTIQACPSSTTMDINLNSTGLGTFSAAAVAYTNSPTQINLLRNRKYLAPELDTWTTTVYTNIVANGGVNPSQYWMAAANDNGAPWLVFAYDLYGYYPTGTCTSCTISSTTLTLGGTITNQFRVGDALMGGSVAGPVTGPGTGAGSFTTITSCTPVGANVCGTTAGDTLGLSQASTVAVGAAMTSYAIPPTSFDGSTTTSPVRAWGAICKWNSNGAKCNGP